MGLHPRALLEGVFYLYRSLSSLGGFFFVFLPLILALGPRPRSPVVRYLALNLGLAGLFILFSGGDWMPLNRFVVPVMPLLFLLIQTGVNRFAEMYPARSIKIIALLAILGQTAYMFGMSLEGHLIHGSAGQDVISREAVTEDYLVKRVRAGDTIAVVQAGAIACRLPLSVKIVDIVGLADSHIAHLRPRFPSGLFGRGDGFGKWDVDYVLSQKPLFVQINLTGRTPEGKWTTLFTGTHRLLNDPRFKAKYHLVQEPGVWGLFARNE